ncbi:hypothetical protein [Marivita sp. GX14005]|uniref:hypothetical protein n=1 Tax=Marivita sp. GX14005 TaxID=2942276 RepID=UPI00201956B4|nr:hypothetical protein [Marivita sp. GX14005]MCL3881246.1 hypothetical protein [Marivita sp. GX14005]
MNRLSVILTLLSGALISGALVVAAYSLGYHGWVLVAVAIVGWLMAWPSALIVARRIKERSPEWSPHSDLTETGPLPRETQKDRNTDDRQT